MTRLSHGTLGVALAGPGCIVVATDSRRTYHDGSFRDDTKKLFVRPPDRVVAIAGLVDASVPKVPGLTAQVPALLQQGIDLDARHIDPYWEDLPPPPDLPDDMRHFWGVDPYIWWNGLAGPLQTILNIAATYEPITTPGTVLWQYGLFGIVAGYQANGAPKVEKLSMIPQFGVSNWGRPWVGLSRGSERRTPDRGTTWATIGVTHLADVVLGGSATPALQRELSVYGGIRMLFERRKADAVEEMTEPERTALAQDLIRATAERHQEVGSQPVQMAVLRPNRAITYEQPIVAVDDVSLPLDGTWHLGVVFTSDYPFADQQRGAVFTFCEVVGNRSPVPLGGNYFYGCVFRDALFTYDRGRLSFGDNNRLDDCELTIATGVYEPHLESILPRFARITRM